MHIKIMCVRNGSFMAVWHQKNMVYRLWKGEEKMERQNDMEELSVNISYCQYCGSKNIIRINDVDCTCNDCGRDYMVITHEWFQYGKPNKIEKNMQGTINSTLF